MNKVYNPANVTISLDGIVLSGFSEDSMVEIEREEEAHLPYQGVLGEHSLAVNTNKNHLATLTFASTSPFLSVIRDIANSDKPVRPFSITNMNEGAQDVATDSAYIVTAPSYVAGKEVEDVEVEIRLLNPTFS